VCALEGTVGSWVYLSGAFVCLGSGSVHGVAV